MSDINAIEMVSDRSEFDTYYRHLQGIFKRRFYKEYRAALERAYAYCAELKKSSALLDIGCYSGASSLLYDKYFSNIELADIRDMRASFVIGRFPFRIFSLGAERLPEDIGQYDFINCIEVLEHIPDEKQALANLRRLLNTGGHLLLATPNRLRAYEKIKSLAGLPTRYPTKGVDNYLNVHYREYSTQELSTLLNNSGFEVKSIQTVTASIGPAYLYFWLGFPEKYKKNIVVLARKAG